MSAGKAAVFQAMTVAPVEVKMPFGVTQPSVNPPVRSTYFLHGLNAGLTFEISDLATKGRLRRV